MKSFWLPGMFGVFFAASCVSGSQAVTPLDQARVAVMSVIGDSISVVNHRAQTGHLIDQNLREVLPIRETTFDDAVATAADDTIRTIAPSAVVLPMRLPLRSTDARNMLFDGQLFVPTEELAKAIKAERVSHLIVLTVLRAPTHLKTATSGVGSGTLEGLGFYVDHSLGMRRSDTGQRGQGFIAPYAYFKVSLIDVATLKVVREESVTANRMLSAARSTETTNPWDALSPERKISTLRALIMEHTKRVVPLLFAGQ